MLHILLEQYINPFKPHMVDIKWPSFGNCRNIFDYAGQFSVIMQLYEKKGEQIEPRKAALKFLAAVKKDGGVTYRAAALLLKTAIMERPPTAHLPLVLKSATWRHSLLTQMQVHQMRMSKQQPHTRQGSTKLLLHHQGMNRRQPEQYGTSQRRSLPSHPQ